MNHASRVYWAILVGSWKRILLRAIQAVCRGPAQKALEASNSNWAREHFCEILAKNYDAFCPYNEDFHGAELKSSGHSLVEEISR